MHRAGRCCVRELRDGISDEAPDRGAVGIALGRELVGACGAFPMGVLAVALEHQGSEGPSVRKRTVRNVNIRLIKG